ncbi:MAG: hypothetical protein HN368_14595 [Spirochaetales bacterium]|jgi:hypothetical protein|nr:hypothetical protein [Spirochaetales bacterium]
MRGTFTEQMDGLVKKIKGDWFDLREAGDDQYALEELFALDKSRLQGIGRALRGSVEKGVFEYKTHSLSSLYAFLDSFRFDSRDFDSLRVQSDAFSDVLYIVLYQRLIALGTIEIKGQKSNEEPMEAELPGLKVIMQDVQERIEKNPELRQDQSIKNILMQVSIYKKELANMKELEPNILPEKKDSFLANFRKRFEDITGKIQEHYRVILASEEKEASKDFEETNPLKRVDLKPIGKLLFNQAEELSAVRSTLQYAVAERFKTREILAGITDRQDRTTLLLKMELSNFEEITGGEENAAVLSKAFSQELIKLLGRQISRLSE